MHARLHPSRVCFSLLKYPTMRRGASVGGSIPTRAPSRAARLGGRDVPLGEDVEQEGLYVVVQRLVV